MQRFCQRPQDDWGLSAPKPQTGTLKLRKQISQIPRFVPPLAGFRCESVGGVCRVGRFVVDLRGLGLSGPPRLKVRANPLFLDS